MNHSSLKKGFSLIELTVVVGIMSVLGTATIAGFNYFGDSIRAGEVVGIIRDTIRQAELSILKGDYRQVNIHFMNHYLILEQVVEGASLDLNLEVACSQDGRAGHNLTGDAGALNTLDEAGRLIEVTALPLCANFEKSLESEWQYQLISGQARSNIIRFVHFNLGTSFALSPLVPASYRLEIEAPYAKKRFYANDVLTAGTATIDLLDPNGSSSAKITLP